MTIKDEIKKLEEVANQELPYDPNDSEFMNINCDDERAFGYAKGEKLTAQDALEIINNLMEVVEMQQKVLEAYSDPKAYSMIWNNEIEIEIAENMHLPARETLEKSKLLLEGENNA